MSAYAGASATTYSFSPQEPPRHSDLARLRVQLATMPVIEQAKGIIVAQSRCAPSEAFDLLCRASQRCNVPVRELAAQLVAQTVRSPTPQASSIAMAGLVRSAQAEAQEP